jgi:PilZ domain
MSTPPPPEPASGVDRRVAPRFQPAFGSIYRFKQPGSDDAIVGLVWNISKTGLSMLLADPPERGGIVIGELSTETGGPLLSIDLRVVHIRVLSTGDYLLGAQFSRPLEPEEMKLFMTPPPRERPEKHET